MIQRISTTLLAGLISGISVSFFLITLDLVVGDHTKHPITLYALPFIGAFLGWLHRFYGDENKSDTDLILKEIRSPDRTLPAKFAPLVYCSTLLTQWVGGSAGREGAAVQISASLCDQLTRKFDLDQIERRTLLIASMSAGFGAAVGTPLSGFLFGLELNRKSGLTLRSIFHVLTATVIAFVISRVLPVPHFEFPAFDPEKMQGDIRSIALLVVSPILFALLVRGFLGSTHFFKFALRRISHHPSVRGFIGGLLLLFLFRFFPLDPFQGLGVSGIMESFQAPSPYWVPIVKLLLTALTLASGFKGGEFVPLVFIGASAGSALQSSAGLHPTLLASLGCVSLFGGAAKVPFTCIALAIELFGLPIAPFAAFAVLGTGLLSGKKTLY